MNDHYDELLRNVYKESPVCLGTFGDRQSAPNCYTSWRLLADHSVDILITARCNMQLSARMLRQYIVHCTLRRLAPSLIICLPQALSRFLLKFIKISDSNFHSPKREET